MSKRGFHLQYSGVKFKLVQIFPLKIGFIPRKGFIQRKTRTPLNWYMFYLCFNINLSKYVFSHFKFGSEIRSSQNLEKAFLPKVSVRDSRLWLNLILISVIVIDETKSTIYFSGTNTAFRTCWKLSCGWICWWTVGGLRVDKGRPLVFFNLYVDKLKTS